MLLPKTTKFLLSIHRPHLRPLHRLGDYHYHHRTFSSSLLQESYENILVTKHDPPPSSSSSSSKSKSTPLSVGLITLNQPKTFNSLSDSLFTDLIHATKSFDKMKDVGSIIITGGINCKAFAAGANIKEMKDKSFDYAYKENMFAQWADISKISKPIIAAVNGYALGGGCELMMMCDIIIASPNAKFGQPEINLGIIPGAGGTQRLMKCIGKTKAMDMILTGKMIDAKQAEKDGLISRICDNHDTLIEDAIQVGFEIGQKSQMAVRMAKEAVNAADEMSLEQGLKYERRLFHSLFATHDQKEGMDAFLNKRDPHFTHS